MELQPKVDTDMGMEVKNKLTKLFDIRGNGRTETVKRNIIQSIILKTSNILISLLLVPIAIRFINTEQFGIWLTLSSIIAWLSFFDIGLSNGLRNKLGKALSSNDTTLAKTYISTTYVVLSALFITLWLIIILINPFIDWLKLLNLSDTPESSIKRVTLIIFSYFCFSFLLKTVNTILLANQKAAYSSLIDVLGQLFALLTIYLMTIFLSGSLLYLSLGMCLPPTIVAIIFNVYLFNGKYKSIAPSLKYFKFSCIKELMGLGIQFFVIQIAAIVQYQTANIIIARSFSMEEVTNYNITFKYFSILSMFFGIILLPLWSATTDAYHKHEFEWIKATTKRYLKLYFVMVIIGVVMLIFSNYAYILWIGKDILSISYSLSFWCLAFVITSMFGNIFVNLLNGIGAIRIQFILSLFTPILYIAICILFISYWQMNVYAIFIAAIISNINGFIIAPIQFVKIFIQKKKGIWVS